MSIHLELLRAEIAGRRPAAEYLAVVSEQLRRLDEVVQTFLKFSRPEQMTLGPVSLITLLEGIRPVVEAEAEAAGIRVSVGASPDLPEVHANYAALENALLNLAINGCQAMPDGGTLTIAARPASGGRVAITITDTGVGIPPEQLDKIFNLYFTTKPQGTGVGLAMVYRTVQLHNGEISVESSPGGGTTFTVTLWAESASQAS
jgi:signal transduction histidine kinase